MTRYLVTLYSSADRARAAKYLAAAPIGSRVEFKAAKRTLAQNDRFWAMLTDVSEQLLWHGKKLRADDWKLIFLDGLKRELNPVPNLDNTGFVNLGRSSSDLTREEMGQLMELIEAFGAQHGVQFHDSETSQHHQKPPSPGPETPPAADVGSASSVAGSLSAANEGGEQPSIETSRENGSASTASETPGSLPAAQDIAGCVPC